MQQIRPTTLWPLVSIGVPTYNRAVFLDRALSSAVGQTYPNVEVVISDNASTDDTEQVCKHYCDQHSNMRYIRQPLNQGWTNNFEVVFNLSSGQFFMWLGDDDWIHPLYIERCMALLLEDPACALVCGRTVYISKQGQISEKGLAINLTHRSSLARVCGYYSKVGDNSPVYGLFRKHQPLRVSAIRKLFGDWFVVASLAFIGQVRTLEGVSYYRNVTGISVDLQSYLVSLNASNFQRDNPYLTKAVGAFMDIVIHSPVYHRVGVMLRLRLACAVFKIICGRWGPTFGVCFSDVLSQVRMKIGLRTRVKRLLFRHRNHRSVAP